MASLDPSLFDTESNEKMTAIKDITEIGNIAKVPKAQTQFASLFVSQAKKLSAIGRLSPSEKIDLIQACNAHKEPDKLSQLLVTRQVFLLAQHQRAMMLALNSFHAVGMGNIDTNLKGAAIGEALRQARIEHLQIASNQS